MEVRLQTIGGEAPIDVAGRTGDGRRQQVNLIAGEVYVVRGEGGAGASGYHGHAVQEEGHIASDLGGDVVELVWGEEVGENLVKEPQEGAGVTGAAAQAGTDWNALMQVDAQGGEGLSSCLLEVAVGFGEVVFLVRGGTSPEICRSI